MNSVENKTSGFENLSDKERLRCLIRQFQDIVTQDGDGKERISEALRIYWRVTACKALIEGNWGNFADEVARVLFSLSDKEDGKVLRRRPVSEFVRKRFREDIPDLLNGVGEGRERAEEFCRHILHELK